MHYSKLIALLLSSSASVAAESAAPPLATWRSEADARIEEFRKGDLTLVVSDSATGKPVADHAVSLEMKRHAYLFGTVVNEEVIVREGADGDKYRDFIQKNFNASVLENHQKWKMHEDVNTRARTDAALAWIHANGLAHRGHTQIWQTFKYGVMVPIDVHNAILRGQPEDLEHVRRRSIDHVTAIGTHYRDQVVHWDVLNEQVQEHHITALLHPDVPPSRAPILVDWFKAAKAADPGAKLYINDYNILAGNYEDHKSTYEDTIRFLIEQNAPLEGIGFQGHFSSGQAARTPEQTWQTLERFARFGLPLAVTEFDMFGTDWGETLAEEELAQAEFFEQFLVTVFSHPSTDAFLIWGFWDGAHWTNKGVFFRKDWTPKPAYYVWRRLVYGEWFGGGSLRTDETGTAGARLFYGDYEATITDGELSHIFEIRHRPGIDKIYLSIGKDR